MSLNFSTVSRQNLSAPIREDKYYPHHHVTSTADCMLRIKVNELCICKDSFWNRLVKRSHILLLTNEKTYEIQNLLADNSQTQNRITFASNLRPTICQAVCTFTSALSKVIFKNVSALISTADLPAHTASYTADVSAWGVFIHPGSNRDVWGFLSVPVFFVL